MIGGDGGMRGSISRSKIAEDDECLFLVSKNELLKSITRKTYTEVGEDGIEFGEREPKRPSVVRR